MCACERTCLKAWKHVCENVLTLVQKFANMSFTTLKSSCDLASPVTKHGATFLVINHFKTYYEKLVFCKIEEKSLLFILYPRDFTNSYVMYTFLITWCIWFFFLYHFTTVKYKYVKENVMWISESTWKQIYHIT